MRFKAGAMGYSLNQRGLYAGIVRDPHDRRIKLTEGQPLVLEDPYRDRRRSYCSSFRPHHCVGD